MKKLKQAIVMYLAIFMYCPSVEKKQYVLQKICTFC